MTQTRNAPNKPRVRIVIVAGNVQQCFVFAQQFGWAKEYVIPVTPGTVDRLRGLGQGTVVFLVNDTLDPRTEKGGHLYEIVRALTGPGRAALIEANLDAVFGVVRG